MPRKIPPMDMKFVFELATVGRTDYLDIGQIVSLVNRKAARQGYEYFVSNIEIITNGDFLAEVSTLPQSWTCSNAWVKSFKLWQESQDQVLDVEGRDILGKYADFKIYYDSTHKAAGVAGNLRPYGFAIAAGGATYKWDPSTYQVPNDPVGGTTTEYTIHGIGPSTANSLGMISGYAASRARPQQNDPNVVDHLTAEDWMLNLFDVGENLTEIREDIEDDNDAPPYLLGAPGSQLEYYPGGTLQAPTHESFLQDILATRAGTSLAMDSTGPFTAPCGLIRLDTSTVVGGQDPTFVTMFVELSPGPYKGILARPMQDVN